MRLGGTAQASETCAKNLQASRAEVRRAAFDADAARAAGAEAEAALAAERARTATSLRALRKDIEEHEEAAEYAARTNAALARAKAEAEARAAAVGAAMRTRLQEVTATLSAEARHTQELLRADQQPAALMDMMAAAGRLTMRGGPSDGARRSADSEEAVAVSPGVAAPRPAGFARAFVDN